MHESAVSGHLFTICVRFADDGAEARWGGQGRSPLHTLSLRASPRREASALGVQTGAAIRFPTKKRTDSHASDTVTGSE